MDFDDFPLSPSRAVDPVKYLAAYLEAQNILGRTAAAQRPERPDRELLSLTNQIYSRNQAGAPLFRAHRSAPAAGAAVWVSRVWSIANWAVISGLAKDFAGLNLEFARSIPRTSTSGDGIRSLERILLERGIILVHEPSIPGTKVDGCVLRLATGHIAIGISLRYARLDYYYFTLMHELGHVHLHLDQLDTPIVDDLDHMDEDDHDDIELEANRFARDMLIPRNEWRTATARTSLRQDDVTAFAERIGVAPQIVAGRIRNEKKRHDLFSAVVHAVDIRELLVNA